MIKIDNEPWFSIDDPRTYEFEIGEKQDLKRLKKELGPNWAYYDYKRDPIVTTRNKFGYRSKTEYPTDEYYLSLGCSNTFGQYLHLRDVASNKLEHILNTPVINLGICGGGANAMGLNIQKLMMSDYPKPKAIFAQWPQVHRYTVLGNGTKLTITPETYTDVFEVFIRKKELFETMSKNAFHYVNSLNIPVINYTINGENSNFYDIPYIPRIDNARDNRHSGPETNQNIVNHILENL
jgi:hypothetical protein